MINNSLLSTTAGKKDRIMDEEMLLLASRVVETSNAKEFLKLRHNGHVHKLLD